MRLLHRWLATPLVLTALWVSLPAVGADQPFPRKIDFTVRKAGTIGGGAFKLIFEQDVSTAEPRYQIVLRDFGGMGLNASQKFSSRIFQSDLSLAGHAVVDTKTEKVIRQVFLDRKCTSSMGSMDQKKTNCFIYKDEETQLQTEIFAPYPAIDLVSSIVVATDRAADPDFRQADYNFIFNKATKQVTLVFQGEDELETADGIKQVKILSLLHKNSGQELYRFFIGHDERGHYPLKMSFEDDQGRIDFIADRVVWS